MQHEGREQILRMLVGSGLTARLFTNDVTLDEFTEAADLNEPTAADYLPKVIRPALWDVQDSRATCTEVYVRTPPRTRIVGWWISAGDPPRVILAGRLPEPVAASSAGGILEATAVLDFAPTGDIADE